MKKYDIFHWDFHAANVLAEGRRVTGVIDWDATTAGDRLFDLATLLYYLPESRRVHRYVAARTGFGLLSAYLAHMCIRQTEWSLRRHDGATGERMLSHALAVADEFGIGAE